MILATDIGNSNIVFGIYTQQEWQHQWRLETSAVKSAGDYATFLASCFLENSIPLEQVRQTILSSVVPNLTPIMKNALSDLFAQEPIVLGANIYPKLPLGIERPHEIGADLVANAMAAYEKYRQHCIIVDFGTALTFTTVSEEGKIIGVAIAPGLKTAMYSLFQNTAQLPDVPLEFPESALGRNTTQALQAGVLMGYVGLVENLIRQIKHELQTDCKVIATGGLAFKMKPLHPIFDEINLYHTLDGLRIIGEYAIEK